jgi:hypothetical protein
LADALAEHWEPAVREAGVEPYEIWRAFGLESPVAPVARARGRSTELYLESCDSIDKLRHAEWDAMMRDRGCLGAAGMTLFESLFGPEAPLESPLGLPVLRRAGREGRAGARDLLQRGPLEGRT